MRRLIQRFLKFGLDFNVKDNVKKVADLLGVDRNLVDQIYIEIQNELDYNSFKENPFKTRVLLLPQCLRNSMCKAPLEDSGYTCHNCEMPCTARDLKSYAEKLGYSVYIVPGGSMAVNVLKSKHPRAVVAVACLKELEAGLIRVNGEGFRSKMRLQLVPLLTEGCKDTLVDVKKVKTILRSAPSYKAMKA